MHSLFRSSILSILRSVWKLINLYIDTTKYLLFNRGSIPLQIKFWFNLHIEPILWRNRRFWIFTQSGDDLLYTSSRSFRRIYSRTILYWFIQISFDFFSISKHCQSISAWLPDEWVGISPRLKCQAWTSQLDRPNWWRTQWQLFTLVS